MKRRWKEKWVIFRHICNRLKRHSMKIPYQTSTHETDQNIVGVAWNRTKGQLSGVRGWWNIHVLAAVATQIYRGLHRSCPTCRDRHHTTWRVPASLAQSSDHWISLPATNLAQLADLTRPFCPCHRRNCSCSCGFLYSFRGLFCSLCDFLSAPYVPMIIWVMPYVTGPAWMSNLFLGEWKAGGRTINLLPKHRWGLITYCLYNLWARNHRFLNSYLHHPAPLSSIASSAPCLILLWEHMCQHVSMYILSNFYQAPY